MVANPLAGFAAGFFFFLPPAMVTKYNKILQKSYVGVLCLFSVQKRRGEGDGLNDA